MALVVGAVGFLGLIMGGVFIRFWVRHSEQADAAVRGQHNDQMNATFRLTEQIALLAARPLPTPPDLSFLESFVAEQSRALQDRMDTINQDQAVLTTRVETGPGKRTISFP